MGIGLWSIGFLNLTSRVQKLSPIDFYVFYVRPMDLCGLKK